MNFSPHSSFRYSRLQRFCHTPVHCFKLGCLPSLRKVLKVSFFFTQSCVTIFIQSLKFHNNTTVIVTFELSWRNSMGGADPGGGGPPPPKKNIYTHSKMPRNVTGPHALKAFNAPSPFWKILNPSLHGNQSWLYLLAFVSIQK